MNKVQIDPEQVNPHFKHPEAFGLSREDMKKLGLLEESK